MELVAKGKHFRVFHNKFLGLWSYFIIEDSSDSSKSNQEEIKGYYKRF